MNIAIFSTNVTGIYSGGRYLSLIMAYALARAGAKVTYYTNLLPAFQGDFEGIHQESPVEILTEEHWPEAGNPSVDWVIIIPTGGLADTFYRKARNFAERSQARIALLSFETANWFNDMARPMRSALPWEGWASVISDGGLVLTIAEEGIPYARQFYESLCPDATLLYDFWHPAINDLAANYIGWRDIPTYPNRIACFVRTQDQHKGAFDLLEIPSSFFRGKTLCLIFGRGIDTDFVARLRAHTASVTGCRIHLYQQVTDEEKMAILASCSVLLFPSHFEGFGYPPIEAAYVGTPTAAYNLPVLRETLGEQAGLAAVGDVAALAQEAHRLANTERTPAASLPIPARCELIEAGKALIASLERAEPSLQPLRVDPAGLTNATISDWTEKRECWINAEAVLQDDGTVSVYGLTGVREHKLPITICLEGIDVAKFGEVVSTFPGAYQFHGQFEESLCASRGIVRIAVWKGQQLLEKRDLPVWASPEQKLAKEPGSNATSSLARAAFFSIEDTAFGRTYSERLGLKALLSEASILGYAPVLDAPGEVIERLAATPELSGAITTLARAIPDRELISKALHFQVLTVEDDPARFLWVEKESTNAATEVVHCYVNRLARLIGSRSPELAFANQALPRSSGSTSLYLLNCCDGQGIRTDALEVASLVVSRLGQEYGDEICFLAPSQQHGMAVYQVATEADFVRLHHIEGALLVDCARDDADRSMDNMGSVFADVAVYEFASIIEATTVICQKIQEREATAVAQGMLRNIVVPNSLSETTHASSLTKLRHAAGEKNLYDYFSQDDQESLEKKNALCGGVIYKSMDTRYLIESLVHGTQYRIHKNFVEFRSTDSVILEFDIIEPCDYLTIDAVLMIKAPNAKNIDLEISCDGGPRATRSLSTNIFERVTCVFGINDDHKVNQRHRLEIFISDKEAKTMLRMRAVSFVLEERHSRNPQSREREIDKLPFLQFPPQDRLHDDAPAFQIALGAPESVIACGDGWGDREAGFRWTIGHITELLLPYRDGWPVELELAVTAGAFLAPGELSANMIVQIGAQQIGILTFGQEPETQIVVIPEAIGRNGFEHLELIIEQPRTPASLGFNDDIRELGFCVFAVAIRKAGSAVPATDQSVADDAEFKFGRLGA